jgi:predicted permease
MTWWGRFRRRAALDRDLERELQDHRERRAQALLAAGLTPAQARRQALVESGGAEQVKEAVRDVRGTRWAHDLAQDLRYGVRWLLRSPGLLAAAVLSMGLGIGANTAIFSLVDAVLLRSLPVRAPHELVVLGGDSWTNPIWEEVQRHSGTFAAGALAWSEDSLDLSKGGEVDPAAALLVSGGFFETLGVQPALGRLLTPADDRRGGGTDGPSVVLSQRFWERRFGGDSGAVGRTLAINGVPFTIVGVVPARFLGPTVGRSFDVAVPIGTVDLLKPGSPQSQLDGRSTWWLSIMFRLAPGQTLDSATAALAGVLPQIREATRPPNLPAEARTQYLEKPFTLEPAAAGLSELRRHYREPLLALMGIVALVLLVGCANVANLLLARAAARRHELAARLALGASHGRLVRQLLAESLVLAVTGAIVGLAIALWGSRFLVAQLIAADSQVALALPLDWRLLGFLTGLSVMTAIGFGLAPAWRTRRLDASDAISQASQSRVTRRGTVSGPLVVGQVALSLVLVVAAGLFGRTFSTLATRDLGLDPDGLQQVGIASGRVAPNERAALFNRVRDAAARVPGVRQAATAVLAPLSSAGWNGPITVPGAPPARNPRESMAMFNAITPGWFATHGTPLVAGRDFDTRDDRGAPVAIVNQAFTRRFFGGRDAVGRRVLMGMGPRAQVEVEIIGVSASAVYRGVRGEFPATLYRPVGQMGTDLPPFMTLSLRTTPGAAGGLHAAVTRALRDVDPTLTLTYGSAVDRIRSQLTETRIVALLSSFFGVLALILAAIGLYGVTSYGVTERRREIGIRLTLGAGRGAAQALVLRRVATHVTIGVALGVAASLSLTPLVKTMLYQLEPRDPATIVGAAIVLSAIGLLAGWVPARRAASIDPAQVLREG